MHSHCKRGYVSTVQNIFWPISLVYEHIWGDEFKNFSVLVELEILSNVSI